VSYISAELCSIVLTPVEGHTVLAPIPHNSSRGRQRSRCSFKLDQTQARDVIMNGISFGQAASGLSWLQCKSIVASSGDVCQVGSWVFGRGISNSSGEQSPVCSLIFIIKFLSIDESDWHGIQTSLTGHIVEILRAEDNTLSLAILERYQVAQTRHLKFDMPILIKPFNKTSKAAVCATVSFRI
jgi:hypothetical protein